MMRVRGFCVLLMLVQIACGEADERAPSLVQAWDGAQLASPPPTESSAEADAQSMWADQKLIRTADLDLKVDSARSAMEEVARIATAHDGLVADSRIASDASGREHATVSLRVPADHFDAALTQLRQLGAVQHEAVHTQDVTKEYADLETRLAVKEETAARLRHLLGTQAGTLSDVLDVERELGRVTADIELLKGERRYYDQRVAYSTIDVSLVEPGALAGPRGGLSISQALRDAGAVLSTSIAGLLYLVVFLAPWLALATLGWWGVRRFRARRSAG